MTRDECLAWAARHHALKPGRGLRALADALRLLDESAPRRLPTRHFQAALNSRDLLRVVKLVHVAENAPGGFDVDVDGVAQAPAKPGPGVARRRRGLAALLRGWNRRGAAFDAGLLERLYGALLDGPAPAWFPIVGFEYHPERESFPELSLYAEHAPAPAWAAACAALGVPARRPDMPEGKAFAVGLDLLADGGCRLKLYLSVAAVEGGSCDEALSCLDRRLRPERALLLLRAAPGAGYERGLKVYVPLRSREPGRVTALAGADLGGLSAGRLRRLAEAAARPLHGQHVFYVGFSEEKVELYFGRGGSS